MQSSYGRESVRWPTVCAAAGGLACLLAGSAVPAVAQADAAALSFRIESENNVFEPDSGPWSGGHAATIVRAASGALLAAWRRDIDMVPNNETWISNFVNGRWTRPRILATGSESGDDYTLENVVLFQPKGGPLMLFYYTGPRSFFDRKNMLVGAQNMWGVVRTSTDDGRTWSPPRPLGNDPRVNGGRLCGPTKNPPIQLPDGSILIPSSNEPSAKKAEKDFRELTWHFEKSTDMGKTWSLVQVLAPSPFRAIQPGILILGGGKLIALGRNEGKGNETPMAVSSNWGATWSEISGLAVLPQSHSGIAPVTLSDGTHICILNTPGDPTRPRDRLDLMVSRNGVDWNLGLTLNPAGDGTFAHYPQAVETPDGKLHVVFTYGPDTSAQTWRQRVIRHMVLARGRAGGRTGSVGAPPDQGQMRTAEGNHDDVFKMDRSRGGIDPERTSSRTADDRHHLR